MDNTENLSQEKSNRVTFPLWKKVLLGIALLIGMTGLILHGISASGESDSDTSAKKRENTFSTASDSAPVPLSFSPQGPTGFAPSGDTLSPVQPDTQEASLEDKPVDWSIPLMKLGFSFVVGFCIGYALISFMKLTAIFAGLILLTLFGLQYAGFIDVNWHNMEANYDAFIVWLQPGLHDFREFITGNLPSSGMASLGIVTAFKKK